VERSLELGEVDIAEKELAREYVKVTAKGVEGRECASE
jgi:hypothetical protein